MLLEKVHLLLDDADFIKYELFFLVKVVQSGISDYELLFRRFNLLAEMFAVLHQKEELLNT